MKTFRFFRGRLSLALLVLLSAYYHPANAATPVDRVTATIAGATYELDIEQHQEAVPLESPLPPTRHKEKHPGQASSRELSIRCVDNCKSGSSYRENIFDSPISAFCLWDGSPDFITIWASGSAYWVRIYHVADGRIGKVLDEATKSAPQFGIAADGTSVIVLNNPNSSVPAGSFRSHGEVWKWNGEGYRVAAGETEDR